MSAQRRMCEYLRCECLERSGFDVFISSLAVPPLRRCFCSHRAASKPTPQLEMLVISVNMR